tara:strand:+ start:1907 stop:2632 length:726 start_codon:yes stop_codon:yes gene_type:complete
MNLQHAKKVKLLEAILGFEFTDHAVAIEAITHSSYLNETSQLSSEPYERLEFLGDAVIDLIVATELFDKFPGVREGVLTELKAEITQNSKLAEISESLGITNCLLVGRSVRQTLDRNKVSTIISFKNSILANVLEAIIGAIYIDQGFMKTREIILALLNPLLDTLDPTTFKRSAKSTLQEVLQKNGSPLPVYVLISDLKRESEKRFTVQVLLDDRVAATGYGSRKALAEENAALSALQSIK